MYQCVGGVSLLKEGTLEETAHSFLVLPMSLVGCAVLKHVSETGHRFLWAQ